MIRSSLGHELNVSIFSSESKINIKSHHKWHGVAQTTCQPKYPFRTSTYIWPCWLMLVWVQQSFRLIWSMLDRGCTIYFQGPISIILRVLFLLHSSFTCWGKSKMPLKLVGNSTRNLFWFYTRHCLTLKKSFQYLELLQSSCPQLWKVKQPLTPRTEGSDLLKDFLEQHHREVSVAKSN